MGHVLGSLPRSRRWVFAGSLLLLAALVLVTAGGPVDYLSAAQPTSGATSPEAATSTPSAAPTSTASARTASEGLPMSSWGALLWQLLIMLGAVATAYLLLRWGHVLLHLGGLPRRRSAVREPVSVPPLPEVPEELIGERASRRRHALAEGEPRNAIVAAWVDLEDSTAASGLGRRPAEAPLEYVSRVLDTWDVDTAALADLANLYREARFSTHPLGPEHRERALRDLDRVHEDLVLAERTGGPAT